MAEINPQAFGEGVQAVGSLLGPSRFQRQQQQIQLADLKAQQMEREAQAKRLVQDYQDRVDKYNADQNVKSMLQSTQDPNALTYGDFIKAAGRFADTYAKPFFEQKKADLDASKLQADQAKQALEYHGKLNDMLGEGIRGIMTLDPADRPRAWQEYVTRLANQGDIDQKTMAQMADESDFSDSALRSHYASVVNNAKGLEQNQKQLEEKNKTLEQMSKHIDVQLAGGDTYAMGFNPNTQPGENPYTVKIGQVSQKDKNIDPNSPEGIAARLEFERKKPKTPPTVVVQTTDENGDKITKIVPKVAGAQYASAPTAQEQNRREQAGIIMREADRITKMIDATPNAVGPILGRIARGEANLGIVSPEAKALGTALGSFEALQPILHGFRGGSQTMDHFHSVLGDQRLNAAALKASLSQIKALAQDIKNGKAGEDSETIRMVAPNGQERDVPADQVQHFKSLGAKVKQ